MRLSRAFLQSTAVVTGPGPHQRGTVCQGHGDGDRPDQPYSTLLLATVAWAHGESGQVNVANLELQPGNPPLERPQLKPLAGGRQPGGSSGTSIVEPSSTG